MLLPYLACWIELNVCTAFDVIYLKVKFKAIMTCITVCLRPLTCPLTMSGIAEFRHSVHSAQLTVMTAQESMTAVYYTCC